VGVGANGTIACGRYRAPGPGGAPEAVGVHVLSVRDGRVADIVAFVGPTYAADVGLPPHLAVRVSTARRS
jgi:hypothetical protein